MDKGGGGGGVCCSLSQGEPFFLDGKCRGQRRMTLAVQVCHKQFERNTPHLETSACRLAQHNKIVDWSVEANLNVDKSGLLWMR